MKNNLKNELIMADRNFVVENLPNYVAENRDLMLANFGLAGVGTRGKITTITGVKSSMHLNFLEIEPELQNGAECGFTPQDGGLELTNRTIVVAPIKVDIDVCPRTLRQKYAQYLVRMNAVEEGKRMPFEAEVLNGLVEQINKKIEKLIWMGDTSSSSTDLKWIDGLAKQIAADSAAIQVTGLTANAYDSIQAVYMAMPEETLDRGGLIFVSPAIYRAFLQDMVVKNYFHYAGAVDAAPEEFIFPGTDVKVVKTPGLAGSKLIVGTFGANLVYGTDMEHDEEDIDFWYSKDDRVFKMEALWVSGVNYYFPSQIAYGTML